MSTRWIALVSFVAACDAPSPPRDAAPADATRDAALDAGPAGISKGPWVLRMDTTRVTVRWESRESPAQVALEVEALAGGSPPRRVEGIARASTVTAGYGEGSSLVREPDRPGVWYLAEVNVTGLSPASCYRYRVLGHGEATGRFCTAHEPTDRRPIRFLAIGDTNPVLGSTVPLLGQVLPREPEFTIHLGDIQYYSSVVETWQVWFRMMAPLLRAGAFQPSVGNHENELMGREFADYYARLFAEPGVDGSTTAYHFATGGVHFFSLSTESALGGDARQRAWLAAALTAAEASPGYRFSVLYFHRPAYTLGEASPRLDLRAELTALVAAHRIPLVLAGHQHAYERFEVGATTWLVSGGGGGALADADANLRNHPDDARLRVAAGSFFHAVVLTVEGNTLRGEAIDVNGAVRDRFSRAVP